MFFEPTAWASPFLNHCANAITLFLMAALAIASAVLVTFHVVPQSFGCGRRLQQPLREVAGPTEEPADTLAARALTWTASVVMIYGEVLGGAAYCTHGL